VGKVGVVGLDEKGRMTVPKGCRRKLGITRKVLVINAGDHLEVMPLPAQPVQELRGVLRVNKPFKTLRRQAEALAEKEIGARG